MKETITFECDKDERGIEMSNYSQRNNQLVYPPVVDFPKAQYRTSWKNMCNVTSMVMALEYAGFKFPSGEFEQPEDNLAQFILTNTATLNEYEKCYPAMYKTWIDSLTGKAGINADIYPPTEIHSLLSCGTNKWLQTEATKFETDRFFLGALYQNLNPSFGNPKPLVVSTTFGGFGHIVVITGAKYYKADLKGGDNVPTPISIIIDDPWGKYNYLTNKYDLPNCGNDIEIPFEVALSRIKPINDKNCKWIHTFNDSVKLV